jgi:hypothetical protein
MDSLAKPAARRRVSRLLSLQSVFTLLAFAAVFYSGSAYHARTSESSAEENVSHRIQLERRLDDTISARGASLASPGHQSPEQAPPIPASVWSGLTSTSDLQRRDALLCGPDQVCADGRYQMPQYYDDAHGS